MTASGMMLLAKLRELEDELKENGLWQNTTTGRVNSADEASFIDGEDFALWLQFVFLPAQAEQAKLKSSIKDKKLIVPQAAKFFSEDVRKGKLLQILIELDSLL